MDDEALLDRARHGDRDAFSTLVIRYQDELYTMALRLLGSPADAADVVQETFLRAYVNVQKLRGVTVRAWLYRVAINAAHDVRRRTTRHPTMALEDEETGVINLPDAELGPEATTLAREQVAAVRSALLAIPEEFRVAVVLRDVNDLSYEEMAHALGIPVGTVKSRLSRGRALAAEHLRTSSALFAAEGES